MYTFNNQSLLPKTYPFIDPEDERRFLSLSKLSPMELAAEFVHTYGEQYIRRSQDAYYILNDKTNYWIEIPKYRKSTAELLIREFLSRIYIERLRTQYIRILNNRKPKTEEAANKKKAEKNKIQSLSFNTLTKEAAHAAINHINLKDVEATDFQPKALNLHLLDSTTDLAYIITVDHTQPPAEQITKRLALPEDHVLKDSCITLPHAYDPQNPPPPPTRTQKEVFSKYFPRQEELDYVLINVFGMAMHGRCKYKQPKMFAFTGVGSNGKSTLLNLLAKTLEPLSDNTINADLIMQKKYGNSNYAIGAYQLRNGARIAIPASDITTSKQYVWNQDQIKMVTRMEPISGSDKYVAATRFTPQATIMFSCNALPTLEGQDTALLSRLEVIPMTVIFKGTPNPNLVTELIEEERLSLFHFFLTKMLQYQELFDNNLIQPSPFEGSKQDYIESQEGMRVDGRVRNFIQFYTETVPDSLDLYTTTTALTNAMNELFKSLTSSYIQPADADETTFTTFKTLKPPQVGKHLLKMNLNYRVKPANPKEGTTSPTKMWPLRYLDDIEILQKLHLHFTSRPLPTQTELRGMYFKDHDTQTPQTKTDFQNILKDSDLQVTKSIKRSFSADDLREESIYDDSIRDILYKDFINRLTQYTKIEYPDYIGEYV